MTIVEALVRVDMLKEELNSLRPLKKETDVKLWQKFRLEWNYNSNHIEGNTLTYGETQMLLLHNKAVGDHELQEYEEMKAHDLAIRIVQDWAAEKDRDLSETMIRELNKIILVQDFWKEAITPEGEKTRKKIIAGEYKKQPNHVLLKSGSIFHYATPEETPAKMKDLMEFYHTHSKSSESHPVWLAAMLHHEFVSIHPFDDGNGRVARLLVNYVMLRNGYPPVIIKSSEKEQYLTALQKADAGDKESFVIYLCDQLIWSLELSIKAAQGTSIEEAGDLEKEIAVWKKGMSGKKTDLKEKTDELIFEIYKKNIENLIDRYIEKFSQISDLFKKTRLKANLNGRIKFFDLLGLQDNEFRDFSSVIKNTYRELFPQVSKVEKLLLYIHFQNFQNDGINTFDVSCNLSIKFDQYFYSIHRGNIEPLRKNYSENLNSKEIESLVNDLLKTTFEEIKNKVENK